MKDPFLTYQTELRGKCRGNRRYPIIKKLFECANQYLKESDWKDLALIKFCLCAMGIMIGLSIPKEKRKYPFLVAGIVFVATYIPLMVKYVKIAEEKFFPVRTGEK